MKASMCSRSWLTAVKEAPLSDWPCRMENQVSTWLSHEARVGVKWNLTLGCPLGPAQRCEEGGECFGVGACSVVAEEVEAAGLVRGGEHLEKQPAKQP